MANIKNITKKLINAGFSENKLMMMTEKEIREAYKVAKEEIAMKNNTVNVEASNSETLDLEVEMEETTMMRTTQELINDALSIKKIQNKKYVTNEMLRAEYQKLTGEVIGTKKTRMVIITKLQEYINQNTKEEPNTVDVGDLDITHDNAPESIEESTATVVFDDGLAFKILEGVIRQADTNKAHNFISDWMLTSIISELVIGHPLKDKRHEYYKNFTDEQRKILIDIRKAFINKASLITKINNGKVTGYYIPAKVLVWGRHIYLGVACVYRYVNNNKILAEYHVSLNGIKNTATGNITALDDSVYATLDTKCVFVM